MMKVRVVVPRSLAPGGDKEQRDIAARAWMGDAP
jgi:hypothetical protein